MNIKVPTIEVVHFIQEAHAGVYRMDRRTPYFEHPLNVLRILREELGQKDDASDQGCLLHDVEEDCSDKGYTYEYLTYRFGDPATIAHWCCKPSRPAAVDKLVWNFGHYCGLGKDGPLESRLIKITDRLDNTKDFADWKPKFLDYYIDDTTNLIKALAGTPHVDRLEERLAQMKAFKAAG